jgi:hypothetical protein
MTTNSIVASLVPIFAFHPRETELPLGTTGFPGYDASAASTRKKLDIHDLERCKVYYYHDTEAREVTYVLGYAHDGGASCLRGSGVGSHPTDVEFVRIAYDDAGRPTKAYLSAHGRDQGTWLEGDDQILGSRDRMVVYVSLGSHAHYNNSGLYLRIFGFGTDVTSRRGCWWHVPVASLCRLSEEDVANIHANLGSGRMQWRAKSDALVGCPKNALLAGLYRFAYPLSRPRKS